MHYRADIDGLRALAVVPVVLFHLGLPGVSGGFVGVDVFFVISGYLITTILLREIEAGTYSLVRFYERRARRIFPALFVVLAGTTAFASVLFLPSELERYGTTLVGAVGFVSNVVFFLKAGYFAPAAETMPLLHTWSLAVEEQFYVFAPLVLAVAAPRGARTLRGVLILAAAVSLGLCVFVTRSDPSAAFYLPHTRVWELLVGSLLAAGAVPPLAGRAREAAALLGLAMIGASVALIEPGAHFPGLFAVPPVVGAALLLHAGEGTRVGALLSARPLVWIGLVSYSLYLWHWPVIVFAHRLGVPISAPAPALALLTLSVGLAWLSYRFVETPFRRRGIGRRAIFGASALALGVAGVVGFGLRASGGLPARLPTDVVAFDQGRFDISAARGACLRRAGSFDPAALCRLGVGVPAHAVWGDSHGVELADALSAHVPVLAVNASACPPSLGGAVGRRAGCAAHNAAALRYLASHPGIETVVLAARWDLVGSEPTYLPDLEGAVAGLRDGGKRVVVIGPYPYLAASVPDWLAKGGARSLAEDRLFAEQRAAEAKLRALTSEGVEVVWPSEALCSGATCSLVVGDRPVLFDATHPSLTAARAVVATRDWRRGGGRDGERDERRAARVAPAATGRGTR